MRPDRAYTLGIDLATQAGGTGVCKLLWTGSGVEVVDLRGSADDLAAVELARECSVVGIDAPFGWPADWSAAIGQFRPGGRFAADGSTADLTSRETDRFVRQACGLRPMAVAADRIGATAIRSVRLVRRLVDAGFQLDLGLTASTRSASVSEVYPAAALKVWGLTHRGYKPSFGTEACRVHIDAVRDPLDLKVSNDQLSCLRRSADAFDALIAALVARAVLCGETLDAPASHQDRAGSEGWIRIPRHGAALLDLV